MLRRCIATRPLICMRLHLPRQTRLQSTLPEAGAKVFAPVTETTAPSQSPTRRKWHLYAVVGLVGFTIGSWYRILNVSASRDTFETFDLVAKEAVSSTASIFTIQSKKPLQNADEYVKAWTTGIWNVQFKQPQLQIVRAYTPLPPVADDDEEAAGKLRFLIRRDARGGEMSTYLHRLPVGAAIELRGPHIEYPLSDKVKNVVFVAGGTGIAPALQVAHAMFDGLSTREKEQKTLHIIWGNRRREDCAGAVSDDLPSTPKSIDAGSASWGWAVFGPKVSQNSTPDLEQSRSQNEMVKQLDALKLRHNGRIQVSYYVDEDQTWITSATLENALATLPALAPTQHDEPGTQVIVSGPPGFITYLAGPKLWQDGEEKQGPLGGRLAQVLNKNGHQNVTVWKV